LRPLSAETFCYDADVDICCGEGVDAPGTLCPKGDMCAYEETPPPGQPPFPYFYCKQPPAPSMAKPNFPASGLTVAFTTQDGKNGTFVFDQARGTYLCTGLWIPGWNFSPPTFVSLYNAEYCGTNQVDGVTVYEFAHSTSDKTSKCNQTTKFTVTPTGIPVQYSNIMQCSGGGSSQIINFDFKSAKLHSTEC
jgi:hypothetical protein